MNVDNFDSSDEELDEDEAGLEPLKIDWIDLSCFGYPESVALSALPGCRFRDVRRNLESDLAMIRDNSISHVFVLCTNGELRKYRVPWLLTSYQNCGITVHHYPVPDGTNPSIANCMKMLADIRQVIEAEEKVLIHCYGGLGRACVVVICLLLHYDDSLQPDDVIEKIRSIRGRGAVQTVKQYNFIHDFRKLRDEYDLDSISGFPRAISR